MKKKIFSKISQLFKKKDETYYHLKKVLGFTPINMEYYHLAMIHKSSYASQPTHHKLLNNERLEFLGDSVLGTVVSEILFNKYPEWQEGKLTSVKSKLVQRNTLDTVALAIGLDKLIITSIDTKNERSIHINGNAFEALIGAIYLDRGYQKCREFIQKLFIDNKEELLKLIKEEINFKSAFIELSQKNKYTYQYKLANTTFNKHNNSTIFTTELFVNNILLGSGKGYTKKSSEQKASKKALEELKKKEIIEKLNA